MRSAWRAAIYKSMARLPSVCRFLFQLSFLPPALYCLVEISDRETGIRDADPGSGRFPPLRLPRRSGRKGSGPADISLESRVCERDTFHLPGIMEIGYPFRGSCGSNADYQMERKLGRCLMRDCRHPSSLLAFVPWRCESTGCTTRVSVQAICIFALNAELSL